ncbi:MAG: hypothetical protein WDO70_02110 [Alphaproteobacteria bacterium]
MKSVNKEAEKASGFSRLRGDLAKRQAEFLASDGKTVIKPGDEVQTKSVESGNLNQWTVQEIFTQEKRGLCVRLAQGPARVVFSQNDVKQTADRLTLLRKALVP